MQRRGACLLAIAALAAAPASHAGGDLPLASADARSIEAARRGAMDRLLSPRCRQVLDDFRDGQDRPLSERLAVFALPPDEYLSRLALLDGRHRASCRTGKAELVSTPGAPRVLVCPSFLKTVWRDRTRAEVYLIHEMLHTLGLGEDPPTPRQITRQVERRCAP